jgi:hypothetical protein
MKRVLICILIVAGVGIDRSAGAVSLVGKSPFVTRGFAVMRKGPGGYWPLLSVIPPSTRVQVNHCSTYWTPGWCEVTYHGVTGSVRSLQLRISSVRKSGAGARARRPQYLIAAQRKYNRAIAAVNVANENLDRLLRIEARQSRRALATSGSWIEPAALWREKVSAQQQAAFAHELEREARAELDNAEDQARAISSARWSREHADPWLSWWQW